MGDDERTAKPDLTIVGGQPSKRRHRFDGKIKVPVGLEKALYLAANDREFRARLLEDWRVALEERGVTLRPSERAVLEASTPRMLARMIDGIVPSNPRRRKFMGLVAAAATSLAAGTAAMGGGCVEKDQTNAGVDAGVGGDVDTDTDTDTDMDAGDTDTVETDPVDTGVDAGIGPDTDSDTDSVDTENPSDAGSWGALADDDIDGKF